MRPRASAPRHRVKFGGSEDGQDVVDVEVAVDPHCLSALPEERQHLVKDVVYAVSLHAHFMKHDVERC